MTVSEILKENPKVSIIMPVYNTKSVLKNTLDTVLNQTYQDWEIILVDDCSTDGTYEYVKEVAQKDKRIRLFKLKKNFGPGAARKAGFQKARGGIIAFLDSDDLWADDKLEKQLKLMRDNNYQITCSDYEKADANGQPLKHVIKAKKRAGYKTVLLACPIGCSTVMVTSELLKKVKLPAIRKCNDYVLWLRILRVYPYIYGLNEQLVQYRVWPQSISYHKWKKIRYFWITWRKYEHLSVFQSCMLLLIWTVIKTLGIK